jgi:hypothetical protein
MIDNILSAVLTFSLLIGGAATIGPEMFNDHRADAAPTPTPIVTLPQVTIFAHRQTAPEVVVLPAVTITGHRDAATRLAVQTQASEPYRVE